MSTCIVLCPHRSHRPSPRVYGSGRQSCTLTCMVLQGDSELDLVFSSRGLAQQMWPSTSGWLSHGHCDATALLSYSLVSCYHSGDKVSLQTVFFQTKDHVAQAGLELTTQPNMTEPLILLLLSPQCWDYMPGLCGIMDQTQDFMRVRQVPYQLPYLPPSSAKRTAYVVGRWAVNSVWHWESSVCS